MLVERCRTKYSNESALDKFKQIKYISNILITYIFLEVIMGKAKKIASIGKDCVACGCCVKACPKSAIQVVHGVIACVDGEKCVGCGKCEKTCPAAIITIMEREAAE